jgi:hypothetical protein
MAKIKISDEWLDEIIRETDHYYQGEMQQEARASWLLSTNGAIIVLAFGLLSPNNDLYKTIPLSYLMALGMLLLTGSGTALIALMPFNWSKLFKRKSEKEKSGVIEDFIEARFRPDNKWSKQSFVKRIFYHYKSHFVRNKTKSRFVMASSFCLMFVVLLLLFIYFNLYSMN